MVQAYIGLGSNLGDKAANLKEALTILDQKQGIKVTKVASLYETEPVGYNDQDWFINTVAAIETELPPQLLLNELLAVEQAMGRVRLIRWGPRNIDIDLLLYGTQVIRSDDLEVPHPRILERAFVLGPLSEINPALKVGEHSLRELFENLKKFQKISCNKIRVW